MASRRLAEGLRTMFIRRIGPERRTDDRPTCGQWPPRPPDVQRRDVPVPDRLLPPSVGGNPGDRQIDFDEALGESHFVQFMCCLEKNESRKHRIGLLLRVSRVYFSI